MWFVHPHENVEDNFQTLKSKMDKVKHIKDKEYAYNQKYNKLKGEDNRCMIVQKAWGSQMHKDLGEELEEDDVSPDSSPAEVRLFYAFGTFHTALVWEDEKKTFIEY